jgi:coenzyme F420-0:L-glutamate ligase/coenzyme F420-1:gamma-L-glutamate ligase
LSTSSKSTRDGIQVYPIRTELVEKGDDLVTLIVRALKEAKFRLRDGDILVIASKVVSLSQGRLISLDSIRPSRRSRILAKRYSLEPEFAELVLRESDEIYGGVYRALYTLKDDILTANAGIDHKNVPARAAVLWPQDPGRAAAMIRGRILSLTGKRVGVSIIDSRVSPLRAGTIGVTLGAVGFEMVRDCRGKADLYGKPLLITKLAVADDIACAAHLAMGEVAERTPLAVVRGIPPATKGQRAGTMIMPPKLCLFMGVFKPRARVLKGKSRRAVS